MTTDEKLDLILQKQNTIDEKLTFLFALFNSNKNELKALKIEKAQKEDENIVEPESEKRERIVALDSVINKVIKRNMNLKTLTSDKAYNIVNKDDIETIQKYIDYGDIESQRQLAYLGGAHGKNKEVEKVLTQLADSADWKTRVLALGTTWLETSDFIARIKKEKDWRVIAPLIQLLGEMLKSEEEQAVIEEILLKNENLKLKYYINKFAFKFSKKAKFKKDRKIEKMDIADVFDSVEEYNEINKIHFQ